MKPIHFLIPAVAAAALALIGCKSGGGDAIKVGEYASLTGKEATYGIAMHEGTLLAIEQANEAGGVLGKKIELLVEDDQSKAGEPANVVSKLISRDGVVAVLGEFASSRSLEGGPICQQNQIPMISPGSTNADVTKIGNYIFRVCFTDPFQGAALANFADSSLKAKKVAILTDVKSDYSKGLARYFKERYTALGGQITAELDFNGGDKEFKAQLTTIKNSNPDAVFVPGYYNDVALICIQAKQIGLDKPFFGGDGWESHMLTEIAKDAVEGHYFSTHCLVDQDTPKMTAFVAAYKKRFNKSPDAMATLGYDSAAVLIDAIKRAGTTDSIALRDSIAATKNFEGVSGTFSLDENRDAVKALVFARIQNGKFVYHATVNP
ncbi:MAG: ABC transporter substrate-binding protein [Luteolibacter sp.]